MHQPVSEGNICGSVRGSILLHVMSHVVSDLDLLKRFESIAIVVYIVRSCFTSSSTPSM